MSCWRNSAFSASNALLVVAASASAPPTSVPVRGRVHRWSWLDTVRRRMAAQRFSPSRIVVVILVYPLAFWTPWKRTAASLLESIPGVRRLGWRREPAQPCDTVPPSAPTAPAWPENSYWTSLFYPLRWAIATIASGYIIGEALRHEVACGECGRERLPSGVCPRPVPTPTANLVTGRCVARGKAEARTTTAPAQARGRPDGYLCGGFVRINCRKGGYVHGSRATPDGP